MNVLEIAKTKMRVNDKSFEDFKHMYRYVNCSVVSQLHVIRYRSYLEAIYFLLFFAEPLGGVTGLPAFNPPYGNFFLSAGFRICEVENINAMYANLEASVFLNTATVQMRCMKIKRHLPGRSTSGSRPHSSWHLHCRTLHNSLVPRITLLTASWQRIHNHLLQPELGKIMSKPSRIGYTVIHKKRRT